MDIITSFINFFNFSKRLSKLNGDLILSVASPSNYSELDSGSLLYKYCLSAALNYPQYIDYITSHDFSLHQDFKYLKRTYSEHYAFLYSFVKQINALSVVEIGTFRGLASRVMIDASPNVHVTTYDIHSYTEFDHLLDESYFLSGRLQQHLCDLSIYDTFMQHLDVFNSADLIFLDGPKDSSFEKVFLKFLSCSSFVRKQRYLVIDDIKFSNMLKNWFSIFSPKFDATSIGHWSGTGVIDISDGLDFRY